MEKPDPETGENKYTDLNEWLTEKYDGPFARAELASNLHGLYKACCKVLQQAEESRSAVYPPYAISGPLRVELHLWQLGFASTSFVRGGSTCCSVARVLEKDILQGAGTGKFPIEVVPFITGATPGEPLQPCTLVTSIGSSVVTSAYCFVTWALENNSVVGDLDDPAVCDRLRPICSMLLQAMNVSAVYEPHESLSDIVFKSNKTKIEACSHLTGLIKGCRRL